MSAHLAHSPGLLVWSAPLACFGELTDNPRGSTLYTATFAAIQKSRAEANALPPGGCDGNGCSPYLHALNNNATRLSTAGTYVFRAVPASAP